jgi:hypothetical protein
MDIRVIIVSFYAVMDECKVIGGVLELTFSHISVFEKSLPSNTRSELKGQIRATGMENL